MNCSGPNGCLVGSGRCRAKFRDNCSLSHGDRRQNAFLINRSGRENGTLFRASWMTVLSIGFLFGILDVKPVPAIILAQALNGILLRWLPFSFFRGQ
ncbi:MAG: hypothetical protein R2806_20690 [Saprospiraceae bacterium]